MTSSDSQQNNLLEWIIGGVAIIMVVYHLYVVWFPTFNSLLHQNVHLGLAFSLVYLGALRSGKVWVKVVMFLALLLSLTCVVYMHVNYERLHMWAGFPETPDIFIGIALVLVIFFATWKDWGTVFPVLVTIGIIYALFGHHIKSTLGHPHLDPKLVLSNLGIGFEGTYGMLLNASANLVFLFIIFGGTFGAVGIDKFFIEVGTFMGRYIRGGAAQTAVFSSSFVGMCTGAAAANVALTGSYTIPLMKSMGFKPEQAGAIEAMASTGGQLTPPVMGVSIFLMASFLGVSYAQLMATALIPALAYYFVAIIGVILIASRDDIPLLKAKIDTQILKQGAPVFIIPMGIVTFLLIKRHSPAYAASFALFAILAVALLRKATRPTLKGVITGLIKGASMGATIAMACAMIGMFTKILIATGAGPKLAQVIAAISGGNLVIALILTMMLSILLGCAMPTPVAYVVTALVVAPVLLEMGLDLLVAHFFVFYFAILSAVTPPVAGASMVGSKVAGAGYLATAWESFKLTSPFFLVPFFLARNPIILSQSQPFLDAVLALIALVVGCISFMFFCHKFCFVKTNVIERVLFLFTAGLAAYYSQSGSLLVFVFSVIFLTALMVVQWKRKQKLKGKDASKAARMEGEHMTFTQQEQKS